MATLIVEKRVLRFVESASVEGSLICGDQKSDGLGTNFHRIRRCGVLPDHYTKQQSETRFINGKVDKAEIVGGKTGRESSDRHAVCCAAGEVCGIVPVHGRVEVPLPLQREVCLARADNSFFSAIKIL